MNDESEVSPDLGYLKGLQSEGHKLVDCFCVGLGPTRSRMTIYSADGSSHDFIIDTDSETLMKHYREAIQFTGYGPRGLANLIYAEACEKRQALPSTSIRIALSSECLHRIDQHLKEWTHYGFTFHADPKLEGIAWRIHALPRQADSNDTIV